MDVWRGRLMAMGLTAHAGLSVMLANTWFVPDEHWQSSEVAHHLVFGYGYLTWEWKEGIRSCCYPSMMAAIYWLLQCFNLDSAYMLLQVPRFFQAGLSAIGYVHTCKLSEKVFGESTSVWTALSLATSWILLYCGARTLSNVAEMAIDAIGLSYYPWPIKGARSKGSSWFLGFASMAILMRPTAAILWLPLCLWHLARSPKGSGVFGLYVQIGILALIVQLLIDRLCYGHWVVSLYNFLHFNVISAGAGHYGVHPWHWYWLQGVPILLSTHALPFLLALYKKPRRYIWFVLIIFWMVSIFSFLGHKEFRFLLPIIPLAMCIVGDFLCYLAHSSRKQCSKNQKLPWLVVIALLVTNLPVALYLGLVHQKGPLDVMTYLERDFQTNDKVSVLFLMPCHSTPFYSHIHRNIEMHFLTCEPNLKKSASYEDEADNFFLNPSLWLTNKYGRDATTDTLPTHIIMFDSLATQVENFLRASSYVMCARFFNAHFPQPRTGQTIQVFCRSVRSSIASA